MNVFALKKITSAHLNVLDNMLQLYAHEMNKFYNYSIVLDDNGRYRIKAAAKHLSDGWGYFIMASCEYAGFILLNRRTKAKEGVFITEFFILPRYRKGFFYRDVIVRLIATLDGIVEYRVMKNNKRALCLFDDLVRRFLTTAKKTDEHENGSEYFRYTFDTANITYNRSIGVIA